jgi:hypothetical protein
MREATRGIEASGMSSHADSRAGERHRQELCDGVHAPATGCDYQVQWIGFLLHQANRRRFRFVVNWAAIDFDELLHAIPSPELQEFARFWAWTGLERSDGCPKRALPVWEAYRKLPRGQ